LALSKKPRHYPASDLHWFDTLLMIGLPSLEKRRHGGSDRKKGTVGTSRRDELDANGQPSGTE